MLTPMGPCYTNSNLTSLEDFSNRLNLLRVKKRVVALFLGKMTPLTPTSAHFDAPTAMLPALPSLQTNFQSSNR